MLSCVASVDGGEEGLYGRSIGCIPGIRMASPLYENAHDALDVPNGQTSVCKSHTRAVWAYQSLVEVEEAAVI